MTGMMIKNKVEQLTQEIYLVFTILFQLIYHELGHSLAKPVLSVCPEE